MKGHVFEQNVVRSIYHISVSRMEEQQLMLNIILIYLVIFIELLVGTIHEGP